MNQMDVNTGIHQLPSECYPPTDSDDDSFVVLKVDPESVDYEDFEPPKILPSNVIDQSLEIATDLLAKSSLDNIPEAPRLQQISANLQSNSVTSLTSNLSNDEIQKKVELLIEENNKLKEILHQNNLAMKNQYKVLTMWQQDVEKVQESHKKKFIETKAYIKELQQENANLNGMLKQANSVSYLHVDIPEKRINELEETIHNLRLEMAKITDDNIKKQEEIEGLKKSLIATENSNDQQEQRLLEEITTLKITIEKMKAKEVNIEEMDTLKQQLRAAQAYITEVKQSKKAIETEAEANRQKINELNAEISKLTVESDRYVALEDQLAVYKQDFETEKSLNLKMLDDKNKISEDLHNIQRRNQELIEEVERLRDIATFVDVNSAKPSAPERNPPSPPPMTYNCFICGKIFRSYNLLQNHVEYCLTTSCVD